MIRGLRKVSSAFDKSVNRNTIDLFTINVSQIYGYFFPRDLVTSHFINLYLTIVFQYVESTLHTFIVAMSDKLSGCQEQLLLKWYACIKLVNQSILQNMFYIILQLFIFFV